MNSSIQAICFDVGGTLRATRKNMGANLGYIQKLQSFVGATGSPEEYLRLLRSREKEYRHWCTKTMVELSEADLWSKFMLPDFPSEYIRENAVTLNQMWRDTRNKTLLPDAVHTIQTLAQRGYTLAIISNTTSSIEAPQLLQENGISDLFSSVILSSTFGRRKPHPSLFLASAREIGVMPENCAYVGDTLSRDLVGARQSGFGGVVIINILGYQVDEFDPDDEPLKDTITVMKPDFKIKKLGELLDIFPDRNTAQNPAPAPVSQPEYLYDAALSTMWGVDQNIPFNETFTSARKIGFSRFELNHKVSPALFKQWDTNRFYIATVHDPCPAEYTYEEMKQRDFMISSLDETRRLKSIDLIKHTIELACKLGAKSVVIHPGTMMCDRSRDSQLRKLFQNGQRHTTAYETLLNEIIIDRARWVAPYLETVVKSLEGIIGFAKETGVSLGLENRYRYYDLPLPDEMEQLLDLCKEDWFGFQYDVGHAQTLDVMGLVNHDEWLNRFSTRMIGVHLHDVIGITDHQVPGTGDVDFRRIAKFIPEYALKTFEIGPQASLEELAGGLEYLVACGCIEKI